MVGNETFKVGHQSAGTCHAPDRVCVCGHRCIAVTRELLDVIHPVLASFFMCKNKTSVARNARTHLNLIVCNNPNSISSSRAAAAVYVDYASRNIATEYSQDALVKAKRRNKGLCLCLAAASCIPRLRISLPSSLERTSHRRAGSSFSPCLLRSLASGLLLHHIPSTTVFPHQQAAVLWKFEGRAWIILGAPLCSPKSTFHMKRPSPRNELDPRTNMHAMDHVPQRVRSLSSWDWTWNRRPS